MALEARHLDAIALLASGLNIPEAAKRLGFSRITVWNWTQKPEFKVELRRINRVKLRAVDCVVRDCAKQAAETLREIMADTGASEHARIRAAIAILNRIPGESVENQADIPGDEDMTEWMKLRVVGDDG